MPVTSPVSDRLTMVSLLLLTFATGIVDAVSVSRSATCRRQHDRNVIFLGFWFAPHSGVDLTAAVVAFVSFLAGTVLGAGWRGISTASQALAHRRLRRGSRCAADTFSPRGHGGANYHDNTKLILIAGLAMTLGSQNATARQFGVAELSTTVLTSTVVALGFDSRLAGGTGHRQKLRYGVVATRSPAQPSRGLPSHPRSRLRRPWWR